ncbi:MAG: type II secretion system F family protein [Candidatus Brocadiia bacterium]
MTNNTLFVFCSSLSTLLESGVPAERALRAAGRENPSSSLQKASNQAAELVSNGRSLTEALRAQNIFPSLLLQLVEAGERSGVLDRMLDELADFYAFRRRIRRSFLAAIAWPLIQYLLAILVLTIVAYVRRILNQSHAPVLMVPLIGYGIPLSALALFWLLGKSLGQIGVINRILLRLPLLGKVFLHRALARFHMVLSLMLEAALPVGEAVQRAFDAAGSNAFAKCGEKAVKSIEKGSTLTASLRETGMFSQSDLEILYTGEESGRIVEQLDLLARTHGEQAESCSSRLTVVASVVIWLAVATVLAYFIFSFFSEYLGRINRLAFLRCLVAHQIC